jgi:hypothetical protein
MDLNISLTPKIVYETSNTEKITWKGGGMYTGRRISDGQTSDSLI